MPPVQRVSRTQALFALTVMSRAHACCAILAMKHVQSSVARSYRYVTLRIASE